MPLLFSLLALAWQPPPLPPAPLGLVPTDVVVLANPKMPGSVAVAEHYLAKRGIPKSHLLTLDLPTTEDISRADFDQLLREPLRQLLQDRAPLPRVLVTVHGVPLRVGAATPSPEETKLLQERRQEKSEMAAKLKAAEQDLQSATTRLSNAPTTEQVRARDTAQLLVQTYQSRLKKIDEELSLLSIQESRAAVDSELSLLFWRNYPLARWIGNPMHWLVPAAASARLPRVLMVARLDGPTPELCKRLIDDALAAEAEGLKGEAWIDSRKLQYKPEEDPSGTGYGAYDASLRELYLLLLRQTKVRAHLNAEEALFAPQSCRNVALYCGWYSHANFVDCCIFRQGAVAVHIASSEAVSLRDPKCTYWCKNLLEKGACATMGPVAEPYLFAFPRPAEFFAFLLPGEYTLVECYYRTLSVLSWQMTLVGDPLYRPYRKQPQLKVDQIRPSPEGAKRVF